MSNIILIVTGDPKSINSEIIYKCWKKLNSTIKKKIILVSNYELLKEQFKALNYSVRMEKIDNFNFTKKNTNLKVINIDLKFKGPFSFSEKSTSKFIKNSLDLAHNLAINKKVKGIINCAIDKKIFKPKKFGVTEYLAIKNKIKRNSEVMLIHNKYLSVCPITTHIDISEVPKKLTQKLIIEKIKIIQNWFKKLYKKKAKICVLGLNPHNAEFRKNSEEIKIIYPAIKKLRKMGIHAFGPVSADTAFMENLKKFDVIVGMYHDQVLSPFKSIFKFDAINVTLGLKYFRASPDHGTAISLIGKNKADSSSLFQCIKFLNNSKI